MPILTRIGMSTASPTIPPADLAQTTIGRVSAGMDDQRAPMVGQILRIIRDLSGRSERLSVGDLVEFINGDPTIMGRIVTIASSVGYNASGVEINSIHHAVSLIGFDRVRTLAISILLLESSHSEAVTRANRELAGNSLISGLVAAEMCRRGVAADAEMAFICGALRNYGRILAATFLPEQYAETIPPARRGAEESFRATFGLTPLELGREVMGKLLLPKAILNTLANLSPQERRFCGATALGTLIGAAEFGQRFADLLQAPDLNPDNVERRLEALSREYDVDFNIRRPEVRELLGELVGVLDSFRYRAGSYVGTVEMFRRLENLAKERILQPVAEPAAPPRVSRPAPPPIANADSYEI